MKPRYQLLLALAIAGPARQGPKRPAKPLDVQPRPIVSDPTVKSVSVRDRQGNVSRIERTFSIAARKE